MGSEKLTKNNNILREISGILQDVESEMLF